MDREVPDLKGAESFNRLLESVKAAAKHLQEKFDLPLVLMIIDTLSAATNFKDGNDSAEGQFVMNRLNQLSRVTGAFVLAVDHFGKVAETGTRGTSAKEGAADVVLALLADRETNGTISKTRMAIRKLRGGKTGAETPFNLRTVDIGNGDTTCIIEWKAEEAAGPASTGKKVRWPKSWKVFRSALFNAMADHGKTTRPCGPGGPELRTVPEPAVRAEFVATWPAETADAKRVAYGRALKEAREEGLICSRVIGGVDHLWSTEHDKPNTHTTNKQNTM
jgi:AAA domain